MNRSGGAGTQTPPPTSRSGGGRLAVLASAVGGSSPGSPSAMVGEKEAALAEEPIEGPTMMDPNNSEQPGDNISDFCAGARAQGFHADWKPGLHPSAQPYPYGFLQHPTGFMPFPVQPSSPAAPAQNQTSPPPVVEPEMCPGPVVMKESQGDDAGESVPLGRRRKVVVNRVKLSNFSPKEDVFLVKSWLEISRNPIISTRKKKAGFWSRIMSQYNEKRGIYPERSIRSLQSRWDHIKVEGGKFAAYVANVCQDNSSGMSDADKTSLAQANFADVEQYPFAYIHCWDLLKDEPKWMEIIRKGRWHVDEDPSTGFMPFPVQPSAPATVAQNQTSPLPAVATEMCPGPAEKESQGDGAGGSVPTCRQRKVIGSRIKLSNFSSTEDVLLVKLWLEISYKPIIITAEKRDGYWSRIMGRYNEKRGPNPERSIKSLQSRWNHIKVEVGKFAAHLANALRDNLSGMSDSDKISLAEANFADIEQYPFAYMHCWDLLKDQPKWMEINHKGPRCGDDCGIGDYIPPTPNTIDLDTELPSPSSRGAKRPMERDAAEIAAKKSASSSASASSSKNASNLQELSLQKIAVWQEENMKKGSCYEHMVAIEKRYDELRKHNESMYNLEQQKVQLMREKFEMQRLKEEKLEEERILGINLDNCPLPLRIYYQAKQEEILQKLKVGRHSTSGQ